MAVDMALVQAIVRLTLGEQLLLPAVTQAKPPKQPQIEEEIGNRMSRIQSELLIIQSFLSEVDMRKRENQIVETWIAQARTLAYRTEDVVDEYIRIVYQQEQSHNFGERTKILFLGDQNWVALQAVDAELIKILTKLTHLSQMKGRWMEIPSMLGKMTNQTSERRFHRETSSHFLSEEQLVGIQENREKLIDLLQSNNESALSVVSVWGMGGIGKTTLVTNIYKRESQNFQCHAWIFISQSYKIDDILRKLIKELYCRERRVQDETQIMNRVPDDIQNMDTRNLKEILRNFLEQKKYLIILDDVWIPAAFLDLCDCLVDNHQGSRIIITTRIADVASLAHDRCKLQLKPLGGKEAWDLFCKRAFWKERDHACPSAIEKYAKDIVTNCEGLPLAIVSVGNLLSLRQQTESEWRRVYQQFNWELEHNPSLEDVKNVLYLSYNDLPTYLKNCFLYCSMFSEGYLLHRKRLIKLWIAEGFVQERGNNTLEEVAEDYLNELINRSMLQVEETNILGRVRSFRMHYLMRELAFSLSRKESFHTVYDNNATVKVDNDRRLAVHGCGTDMSSSINMPLLRTFKAFNGSMLSPLFLSSVLTKSRYLAVLDLDSLAIETIPDEIGDLFNLRYLGLRKSKVKSLPESIEKLFNLQTLDLVGSDISCDI